MTQDTPVIDDVEQIRRADPDNMYNRIFDLPENILEALKISDGWTVSPTDFSDIANIVVIGMGGSAIGGDIAAAFFKDRLLIPFSVCRSHTLPEYVDDETLVIASSYSGNTEETLSALEDALSRKALIAAISTGGLMADVAKLNDIPMAQLPTGLQPRAAIGYSFALLALFLEKIGLVKDIRPELEQTAKRLADRREKYIEDNPLSSNPAKHIASVAQGKIAFIYGTNGLMRAVADRWKAQFCENGKQLAFSNEAPEFCHNEIVGWSRIFIESKADQLTVFMLRDEGDHPKNRKRMNFAKALLESLNVEVHDIHSMGERPLERTFSLIQLGDFASYYLAVLGGVDPTPIDIIEKLKAAISD